MSDFLKRLAAPFPPDRISWRVGSTTQDKKRGMALAFIDARDCMERLDEVCGPGGWQNRYPHAGEKTVCEIGILIGEQWVWKADGAGNSDVEAAKGALSDAFKRAAVRWGIGRYLYDVRSPWVALEPAGKSYKIADSELPRLRAVLVNGDTSAPADDSKALFIAATEKQIDAFFDVAALRDWWDSEDQKKQRRDFALDASEVDALKKKVIGRKQAIEGKKAA
jgi:hypothetical protein